MADVFDEIDEDLRREKLKIFWDENKSWIVGGIAGAILMTAVMSGWRAWDYSRDTAATAQLVSALSAGGPAALETFARDGRMGPAAAARFIAAGDYLKKGEKDKAVALYEDIADSFGLNSTYRALAKLLSIAQRLDDGDPAKLTKELSHLSGNGDPWRYLAREMEALLAAKQGDMATAVARLDTITADPEAPASIRARAFALREFYAAENSGSGT